MWKLLSQNIICNGITKPITRIMSCRVVEGVLLSFFLQLKFSLSFHLLLLLSVIGNQNVTSSATCYVLCHLIGSSVDV